MLHLVVPDLLTLAIVVTVFYFAYVAVYRLYFSPIAKFPGPKLAALTFGYEFYYDVVKTGRYNWQIGNLHEQYGPIVRINPYELHINDLEYYGEVYPGPTKRTNKWHWSVKVFGTDNDSEFATVDHDLHRRRRAPLAPFFSKRSIANFDGTIQSVVDRLCRRLAEFHKTGQPLKLSYAWAALTADVITDYCFGESFGQLASPDFGAAFYDMFLQTSKCAHILKHCGWLHPLLQTMPEWLVALTSQPIHQMLKIQQRMEAQVRIIQEGMSDDKSDGSHPTIFHELLNCDLPPEEKSMHRMVYEGQGLVGAGTITTAHTLRTISFHLLANPATLEKLKKELSETEPDLANNIPLQRLEQLPYLSAVINEGLRVGLGVSTRLQRIAPDRALTFNDWVIPPGTPVSMSAMYMHLNADVFPAPLEWRPERWLENNGMQRLDKYLVPFSKGTRACLGMNLAYAEMYLAIAAVFRHFDLQLYHTTRDDVETAHDFVNPFPRLDSKGVRVTVKSVKGLATS